MAESQVGRALFVSDLHLRGPEDPNQALFLDFLEQRIAPDPSATLVVVGDLFDFWLAVGDEIPVDYQEVVERLAALPRVLWLEGNHDIGQSRALRHCGGLQVIEGSLLLRCGDLALHINHGDLLDPSDRGHRFLRAFLGSAGLRRLAALIGSPRVQDLGRKLALQSRNRKGGLLGRNRDWLVAAHRDAVTRQQQGTDLSIRGHGHFLGWWPDGLVCLGDWLHFHSYLELKPQAPSVTLRRFRPGSSVDELLTCEPTGELELPGIGAIPSVTSEFAEHAP